MVEKYEFEDIDYGVSGWTELLNTNFEKVEQDLHTKLPATLGEAVSAYDAGYLHTDGTWYKALANITKQPAWGLFIEEGDAAQEIRLQRVGPITNAGWSWTPGLPIYLSPSTPGGLTQVRPASNVRQYMGVATSATGMILDPDKREELYLTVTTTTTSSTTTTTSSSSSTTTTTTT